MRYLLLLSLWLIMPGSVTAKQPAMTPHNATYKIKMISKTSGSQIINVSGHMDFNNIADCEAWITNHTFDLVYEYADAPAAHINSNFSTYELKDGSRFDFSSRRKRNGQLQQELRGTATPNADRSGLATFSAPDGLNYDLPSNFFFPMAHTIKLISLLESDQKIFHAPVFDGSDEDGPFEVNAFIGGSKPANEELQSSDKIDNSLINSPGHNIRMAFFPLNNNNEEAEYEMSLVLHENGVISDIIVDYKSFSVSQTLQTLEKNDYENCKK